MKALNWMKDELFTLEDTFQLTDKLIEAYANLKDLNKDASCELDLLNKWTCDLSLRDLCDRVAASAAKYPENFIFMFSWLVTFKLGSEPDYHLEDLRKIGVYIAANLPAGDNGNEVSDFFDGAVSKFGQDRTKEAFEIMLMNSQVHYRRFI